MKDENQDDRHLLTTHELEVIENSAFLFTKAAALDKVNHLLRQTLEQLKAEVNSGAAKFWPGIESQKGKISRGESYRLLPYQVLDYPAFFDRTNICTLRTMLYWGNFFSVTLHLQGEYLERFRPKLLNNFNSLLNQDIYIAVGESPWHYHYESDNYLLLQSQHRALISKGQFVKLSKKIPLDNYHRLPDFTVDYFRFLLSVLS